MCSKLELKQTQMGEKMVIDQKVFTVLLLMITLSLGALAAPPVPGTYDPETLTFYETGERVPLFYDEPGPMRAPEAYRGVWNFPVLFVETPDVSHTYPVSDWEDQLFTVGTHPTGSMRDFYRELSYGEFDIDGVALGWIMMDNNYEYYHEGNYGLQGGAGKMAKEAVEKAEAIYNPDWSQFDNDGDGKVDGVVIIHMGAGGESGSSNQIWSHVSSFDPLTFDGVEISRYSIQPERRQVGGLETIGTICHEHGHVLGLPDLYDINYTSKPAPVGKYCLMAGGSSGGNPQGSVPAHMSAWCKAQVGFTDTTEITEPGTYTISDVYTNKSNSIYTIKIPDSNEHFLITNRWMDADINFTGLPSRFKGGLLIYHVDDNYDFSNDGRNEFWHVVIEDATPGDNYDLANGGFSQETNTHFGRFTNPDTDGNYHPSGIRIYDISDYGEEMSFKVEFYPVMQVADYSMTALGNNRYAIDVAIKNITNLNANDLVLDISSDAANVNFEVSQINLGSVAANTTVEAEASFIFTTSDDVSSFETFKIVSTGTNFQGEEIPFIVPVNPARVLIVDDDNTKGAANNLEQYWIDGLNMAGIKFQIWETWTDSFPFSGIMEVFDLVIWCDGPSANTAPKADGQGLEVVAAYLDGGGDMIWSSHEFLYSQYPMKGDDDDHFETAPGDFAREYLHILELEHDEYYYHATGVPGTITEGMQLELVDVFSDDPTGADATLYNWWPDEFVADNTCIPILTSNGPEWPYSQTAEVYEYYEEDIIDDVLVKGTIAMLHQGSHRLMFMAAPLHGITTEASAAPNTRQELLRRIMSWFGIANGHPGIDIDVNDPMIEAGEICHVTLRVYNPGAANSVNTFIAMEAYGQWFFGPTWGTEATFYPMDLAANDSMTMDVFPAFEWPSGAGAGVVTFWTVMLDMNSGQMLGNYDFSPLNWM